MTDVKVFIDNLSVTVPKGTKVIRAAEEAGVAIPRFCDHPLLEPVAACRACMVEVPDAGNGRPMKPQPACALDAADGMIVKTGATSDVAHAAQQGILEFLLINHPLDCPMCDKGGECPLQNQATSSGRGESRYDGVKRTFPKPLALNEVLLLDRERCVLCQRCTRFGEQISGDPLLALTDRGAGSQIGVAPGQKVVSYFTGNLAQICPVGALTSSDYRFQARPFDLASATTTCDNCAAGCALRVDQRGGEIRRRLAATDMAVNEEWNCDKGRFGFRVKDRLTTPLVRENGTLRAASWPEALAAAAAGLADLTGAVGVLPGGRLTMENALAYARFARLALGTDSVDARTRTVATGERAPGASVEEAAFLTRRSRGTSSITYADLGAAKHVVLVALEPEDECPMIFLRLRKATRRGGTVVTTVAPLLTPGAHKLGARLATAGPGGEAGVLSGLKMDADTIVLVGERASQVPGLLPSVEAIVAERGARLAWVPRRAGEIGAAMVGCLPGWGGSDEAARRALAAAWNVEALPTGSGLTAPEIWATAARGDLGLLIGGVDVGDLDDAALAMQGLQNATFVVSLEQRFTTVTSLADVVLPVALLAEQAGTFLGWTGEKRPVAPVLPSQPMTDRRVLAELARRMGRDIGLDSLAHTQQMIGRVLGVWAGLPAAAPAAPRQAPAPAKVPAGMAVVTTWRSLLAGSRCLDGDTMLKPRPAVAVAGLDVVQAAGLGMSTEVVITGPNGRVAQLPLVPAATVASGVVCLPDAPWPTGTVVKVAPAAMAAMAATSATFAWQGGER